MTLDQLSAIAREMEALRAAWAAEVLPAVAGKLEDAHAHAGRAITGTLKRTTEGRPTVRKALRSPSYHAAESRLRELLVILAGPSATSLRGTIRAAREAFYRKAFALHRPLVPAEFLITPDPAPTRQNVALVRAAALHGYDPRQELSPLIEGAITRLGAAVALAGNRATPEDDASEILDVWLARETRTLTRAVESLLSDSVEYCDNEALADLIHPEFRAEPAVAAEE